MKNNLFVKKFFLLAVTDQLQREEEGVVDFLIQCVKSQHQIITDLLEIGSSSSIRFLTFVQSILRQFQKLGSNEDSYSEYYLKFYLFSVLLLKNKQLNLSLRENIQRELWPLIESIFFQLLSIMQEGIKRLSNYVKDQLYEPNESLSQIDNIDYYRILQMMESKEVISEILVSFAEIFEDQFRLKLMDKENFFFKKDNLIFFSNVFKFYQQIQEHISNQSISISFLLLDLLKNQRIPEFVRELASHRLSFGEVSSYVHLVQKKG